MSTNGLDNSGSTPLRTTMTLRGVLSQLGNLEGITSLPETLDRTAIHVDTTEGWNAQLHLLTERGHFYIYIDYTTKEIDGETLTLPAVKIGDGTSYLIDMPFSILGDEPFRMDEFDQHMDNTTIHITSSERTKWNDKVSIRIDPQAENLYFVNN